MTKVIPYIVRRLGYIIKNDYFYLHLIYLAMTGKFLHLSNPRSFNEKIQWLKLYNRKEEFCNLVDKYAVKEYVTNLIGEKYVIPTIGVWDTPDKIEWSKLPSKFVLKTTHGGGNLGVVICRDKSVIQKDNIISKLKKSLRSDIYRTYREWPYKNVAKRIIAEPFMESDSPSGGLDDFKFYCFDGKPKYCQVIRDRNTTETIDFFDMDWNHQNFVGLNPNCKNGIKPVPKPSKLKEMISICEKLSADIPFARIDLYDIKGEVYFGEITFFPNSGYGRFCPNEWNQIFGDMIVLPRRS